MYIPFFTVESPVTSILARHTPEPFVADHTISFSGFFIFETVNTEDAMSHVIPDAESQRKTVAQNALLTRSYDHIYTYLYISDIF